MNKKISIIFYTSFILFLLLIILMVYIHVPNFHYPIDHIKKQLKTGDIILTCSVPRRLKKFITIKLRQTFCLMKYTHVGIIYKDVNSKFGIHNELYVCDLTTNQDMNSPEHPQLVQFDKRFTGYRGNFTVRRLKEPVSSESQHRLDKFLLKSINNKNIKFDRNLVSNVFWRCFLKYEYPKNEWHCAEFAAMCCKKIGQLKEGECVECAFPSNFSERGNCILKGPFFPEEDIYV